MISIARTSFPISTIVKETTYPVNCQQSERKSRKAIGDLQASECMQIYGDPGEQEKQGESHMSPNGDLPHFQ
jgi:hypothetical protein